MADTEQLVVPLTAKTRDFERAFDRALSKANDNFQKIEKRGAQSATKLDKSFGDIGKSIAGRMEVIFKPFMAGGILAAGVTAAAATLKEIASTVAEVGREAAKAGVSSKTWQQWAYVATATGANIDGVTDALKELNIRSDEFAKTGKGSAQEAFTRLGLTATDVANKIKDPSAFLDEIIAKLQTMSAEARTRNLDELFGGQGAEEMAKVLGLSVTQIQKLRSEAATFSDEQIESAKKIDAAWDTMTRNISVRLKQIAVESVSTASKIIDFLNDPSQGARDRAIAAYNTPDAQLKRLQDQRASIAKQIADTESNPFNAFKDAELRQLRASLAAVDEQIEQLGGGSKELKAALSELSTVTLTMDKSFEQTTRSAASFQSALAEIKKLVPGLKADLDSLATSNGIDAAYQRAVANARTMGEVMNATDLANRAKTAARYGSFSNILDLIGSVEGGAGGYNATLDNGRWTGGAQNLVAMTLNQVRELQRQMLANPENRALYGDGRGSSALGRYQITGATLESLIKELGLSGDRLFDADTQDELARALLRRRGSDPASLRQEWTGLRNVDDGTIRNAYAATPTGAQKLAPTDSEQQRTALLKQQDEARKSLNRTVQEGLDLAKFEQSISGESAAQQQIELAVYRAKAEAKRAGITLSDQEVQKIREQITATQQLQAANQKTAKSTEGMQQAQQFFAEGFTNALSGLITGTTDFASAMQQLANSILNAALQALLLGQGPLAALGGGGGNSGGGLGGLFGLLFSAKGGLATRSRMTPLHLAGGGGVSGPGGPTGDKIPAMLSDGEFVVNAAATARNRQILEAINAGKISHLAGGGFAGGGSGSGKAVGNSFVMGDINVKVDSVGSSGDPARDEQHNRSMAKQVAAAVDQQMTDWFLNQSRPGGLIARSR